MNVQTKNNFRGFTIIEVVLVLAIAGLIFLMVFIALPALQRSQRDQARKNDTSTVVSAVTSYTSNNRGNFPQTNDLAGYLDDLSDNTETVTVVSSPPPAGQAITFPTEGDGYGYINIYPGRSCGSSTNQGHTLASGTARQFAVITRLESGKGQYFCEAG